MEKFEKRRSLLSFLRQNRPSVKPSGDVPDNLYSKCSNCGAMTLKEKMVDNLMVCPKCGHHHYITSRRRLELIMDSGYSIISSRPSYKNPLGYPDYEKKLKENSDKSGELEAVICARGKIGGNETVVIVMDQGFLMGSMGAYVGEEITKAFEYAARRRLPVVAFTASGGARMQEGIVSLMQMAKTSNAVREHSERGLLYLVVFTHPTTGGVTASFASLGDITISEPGALIGFAGPRVIKQTIGQDLPEGFQTAEFQMEHGFIDDVVERKDLRSVISRILSLHN